MAKSQLTCGMTKLKMLDHTCTLGQETELRSILLFVHLRLQATMKWTWFQIKLFCLFFCQRAEPTYNFLKTIVFQRFYRLLVTQETP